VRKIFSKKSLGQNFLNNHSVAISVSSSIEKNQNVLEVGSGFGFLTKFLAEDAKKVYSIEKDDRFFDENLTTNYQKIFGDLKNIEFVHKDILDLENSDLPEDFLKDFVLVGNLPYNISKKIIQKFLDGSFSKPKEIVIMLQKEVGEQILGKNPSFMTFFTDFFCKTKEKVLFVSRENFSPKPKVDSIVIKLVLRNEIEMKKIFEDLKISKLELESFWKFLKIFLEHKRKKIGFLAKSRIQKREDFDIKIFDKRITDLSLQEISEIYYRTKN